MKMYDLKTRLATHLIVAQDKDGDIQGLRVLVDEPSYKLATKIYKTYISDSDFSKFHAFVVDMDHLIARFGGQAPQVMQQPNAAPAQPQQQGGSEKDDDDK